MEISRAARLPIQLESDRLSDDVRRSQGGLGRIDGQKILEVLRESFFPLEGRHHGFAAKERGIGEFDQTRHGSTLAKRRKGMARMLSWERPPRLLTHFQFFVIT